METLIVAEITTIFYLIFSLILAGKEIYGKHKNYSFRRYPHYLTAGGYILLFLVLIVLIFLLAPPIMLFWIVIKMIKLLFY